jgi:hypothetical protein
MFFLVAAISGIPAMTNTVSSTQHPYIFYICAIVSFVGLLAGLAFWNEK